MYIHMHVHITMYVYANVYSMYTYKLCVFRLFEGDGEEARSS